MQSTGAESPAPDSRLAFFLESLGDTGRALVSGPLPAEDDAETGRALQRLDARQRDELALEAPAFAPETALWAARLFYELCRFTVCRDVGAGEIVAACGKPSPGSRGPETDWSADLVLRHLPKLFQLARHFSRSDPLVQHLLKLAAEWPLSSVGVPGLGEPGINSFIEHPALRRLYADRIIAAADVSRLGDPRLDDRLREDIGIHRDLAPDLAGKLFPATA